MNSQDIIKLRINLGLSQSQLAKKLGVTVSTISRWEHDRQKPSPLAIKVLKILSSSKD